MQKAESVKEHKLRTWLERHLRNAPDIERFCQNHFYKDVSQKLSPGMQTVQMLNILFASKTTDEILAALRLEFPSNDLDAELGLSSSFGGTNGQPAASELAPSQSTGAFGLPQRRLWQLLRLSLLFVLLFVGVSSLYPFLARRWSTTYSASPSCHLGEWAECIGMLAVQEIDARVSDAAVRQKCSDVHVQILQNAACQIYSNRLQKYLSKLIREPDPNLEKLCFESNIWQACVLGGQDAYRRDRKLKDKNNVCRWYSRVCKQDRAFNWETCMVPYLDHELYRACVGDSIANRFRRLQEMCHTNNVSAACYEVGSYCDPKIRPRIRNQHAAPPMQLRCHASRLERAA